MNNLSFKQYEDYLTSIGENPSNIYTYTHKIPEKLQMGDLNYCPKWSDG